MSQLASDGGENFIIFALAESEAEIPVRPGLTSLTARTVWLLEVRSETMCWSVTMMRTTSGQHSVTPHSQPSTATFP